MGQGREAKALVILDRIAELPTGRRGFFALEANENGAEASTGVRLWRGLGTTGMAAGWVRTPWGRWSPMWGARLCVRF